MTEKIKNFIKDFFKGDKFKKLIKFCLTGGLNTLIDFCVYTLTAQVLGWNVYLAQTLGYFAGFANSYTVNRSWTFKNEKKGFFSLQLVKFLAVNLITYGISLVAVYLFVDTLGFNKMIAKLFITACTVLINFLLSNIWVFKNKE